jgi:flagellar hook-basal body complex protein FliE
MAPIAPVPPTLQPSQPVLGGVNNFTVGLLQLTQGAQGLGAAASGVPLASFQEFFADAVKKTQQLQNAAEDKQRQLLVGETDNLHDVMIAMEKASLSFQLTLAVRNKVIEAYQEVMRMQI